MSHFIALIENALKSGDSSDPAFREGVYKGALRAFDKMSDKRSDKAEFRRLHGPQLAEAITRIEQKYVTFEDDDILDSQTMERDVDAALLARPEPNFAVDRMSSDLDSSVEPAVASIDDDVFLDEERPSARRISRNSGSTKLLVFGVGFIAIVLGLLIWFFL
jgi:hypothetical protein